MNFKRLKIWTATYLIAFIGCFTFNSCDFFNKDLHLQGMSRAIYYWKSTYPSCHEQSIMDSLNIGLLYTKAFDIDWDPKKGVIPFDVKTIPNVFTNECFVKRPVVYTVYITNRAMKRVGFGNYTNIDSISLDSLAIKLTAKIRRQINANRFFINEATFKEINSARMSNVDSLSKKRFSKEYNQLNDYEKTSIISLGKITDADLKFLKDSLIKSRVETVRLQLDCDWSLSTKSRYFELLKKVKHLLGVKSEVSCTLRLWQYKNRKVAGIPPVDRVALMLYNMSPMEKYETQNAIFDAEIAKKYLSKPEYPLLLDIALPAFRWGVWFRNGKYKGLIRPEDLQTWYLADTLSNNPNFVETVDNNFPKKLIRIKQPTVIGNDYLLANDEIRPEGISPDNLLEAQALGRSFIKVPEQRLIYYSLQPDLLQNFGLDNLKRAYR